MVANVGEQFAHRLRLPLLGLQFNFLISGEITYRIGLRFHAGCAWWLFTPSAQCRSSIYSILASDD